MPSCRNWPDEKALKLLSATCQETKFTMSAKDTNPAAPFVLEILL